MRPSATPRCPDTELTMSSLTVAREHAASTRGIRACASLDPLVLPEQLSLVGQVSSAGAAVGGALVALTRHTGEAVARTRTAHDGQYRMPLPTSGRYVLTACSPATPASACVPLAVLGMAQVVDLELSDSLEADR